MILKKMGLEGRWNHRPNELSGGECQRVAIARALITDPPILLADEPTGNLDTKTGIDILSLFKTLNREEGVTLILVTHNPEIAKEARRRIYIQDGKIVEDTNTVNPSLEKGEIKFPPPLEKGGGGI